LTYAYPIEVNKFSDLFVWANTVTDGLFGIGLLLLLFLIIFISTIQFESKKAFAISSWLTWLFCSLFWALGVVSGREFFICATFVGISVVWLFLSKE